MSNRRTDRNYFKSKKSLEKANRRTYRQTLINVDKKFNVCTDRNYFKSKKSLEKLAGRNELPGRKKNVEIHTGYNNSAKTTCHATHAGGKAVSTE